MTGVVSHLTGTWTSLTRSSETALGSATRSIWRWWGALAPALCTRITTDSMGRCNRWASKLPLMVEAPVAPSRTRLLLPVWKTEARRRGIWLLSLRHGRQTSRPISADRSSMAVLSCARQPATRMPIVTADQCSVCASRVGTGQTAPRAIVLIAVQMVCARRSIWEERLLQARLRVCATMDTLATCATKIRVSALTAVRTASVRRRAKRRTSAHATRDTQVICARLPA